METETRTTSGELSNNDTLDDAEEIEKDLEPGLSKPKRGQGKVYLLFCSFKNQNSAEQALKEEFCGARWSYRITTQTNLSAKKWYDCSTNDCPVSMQMVLNTDTSKTVTFLISDNHHCHTNSLVKIGIEEKAIKEII